MTTAKSPTVPSFAIASLPPGALREFVEDNLGGQISASALDTVRVPSAGGAAWALPSLEGERYEKAFDGVIVHARNTRSYWPGEDDPDGSPPRCFSEDGLTGRGDPGGSCAVCPLAQFGTSLKGGGAGQACKQQKVVFVLRPDDTLPLILRLPPTSLKAFNAYATRLVSRGLRLHDVVTHFELEQDKSATGIKYSRVVPSLSHPLADAQLAALRAYAADLKPALGRAAAALPDPYEDRDQAHEPTPAVAGAIRDSEAADLFDEA